MSLRVKGETEADGPGRKVPQSRPGAALSDLSFRIIAIDKTAESIFQTVRVVRRDRGTPFESADRVPLRIVERLRRLRLPRLNSAQVEFRVGNSRYSARVFVVKPGGELVKDRLLLFQVEREASTRDALIDSARAFNLSDRELEALCGIADGLTSKEIAVRMGISPSTVDQFLRMVKIKTGARNRAGILARLLAAPAAPSDPGKPGAIRFADAPSIARGAAALDKQRRP